MPITSLIDKWLSGPTCKDIIAKHQTEEDTFNTLRRIPIEELEKLHELTCYVLKSNAETKLKEDIFRMETKDSLGGINMSIPFRLLREMYAFAFTGTGWSPEEYYEVKYREGMARHKFLKTKKSKATKCLVFCLAVSVSVSICCSLIVKVPFLGSFILPLLSGYLFAQIYKSLKKKIYAA